MIHKNGDLIIYVTFPHHSAVDCCMVDPIPPGVFVDVDRSRREQEHAAGSLLKVRRSGASAVNNDYNLMLQTSIICLLLFLVGMTAMVQHPTWFQ
jgi:hypothetical protein